MARIDERLGVGEYLYQTAKTIDGLAWIVICVATIVCLIDILLGINLIPLRDASRASKAIVLLLFSPLLAFLLLVWLRQFPFNETRIAVWVRASLCVGIFLIINFKAVM